MSVKVILTSISSVIFVWLVLEIKEFFLGGGTNFPVAVNLFKIFSLIISLLLIGFFSTFVEVEGQEGETENSVARDERPVPSNFYSVHEASITHAKIRRPSVPRFRLKSPFRKNN
jgi:hypothetical protein